jgi:hypothetical protein
MFESFFFARSAAMTATSMFAATARRSAATPLLVPFAAPAVSATGLLAAVRLAAVGFFLALRSAARSAIATTGAAGIRAATATAAAASAFEWLPRGAMRIGAVFAGGGRFAVNRFGGGRRGFSTRRRDFLAQLRKNFLQHDDRNGQASAKPIRLQPRM